MNNNVFAIVVTYNPDIEQLEYSLSKLLNQVEKIVVVNNGCKKIEIGFSSNKLIIIENGRNLGIAAAQNIGFEFALAEGAHFVLQSDQDSIFPDKTVVKLLDTFTRLRSKGINVGIVCPNHYDSENNDFYTRHSSTISSVKFENARLVSETLSSGSLISLDVVENCGKMNDDLFIDIVDWEYCWKIRGYGYEVVRLDTVAFAHKAGIHTKKIFGKKVAVIPSPIRHYYHTRNVIYLFNKPYVPINWKFVQLIKLILKPFMIPVIYDNRMERMKMFFLGLSHGLQGKLGEINRI